MSPAAMPTGAFNDARFYAIVRRRSGWVVRLVRNGQRFEKSFGDRAYGGESSALAHATDWRDQIIRAHPPPPRRERATRPMGGNGPIPGVTYEPDARGRVKLWRAKTLVSPDRILQKTFSIARYGHAAEQLAIQERHRQLESVDGLSWLHPAERELRGAVPSGQPLPAIPEPVPANQVLRTSNTSGFPGVVRRGLHWTAQTTTGGKWISQSFRIDHHGEEVALILAVWARLDQLRACTSRGRHAGAAEAQARPLAAPGRPMPSEESMRERRAGRAFRETPAADAVWPVCRVNAAG